MACYLLHFDRPFRHARHYLGYSADLPTRLARHASGQGSKLVAAAKREGIGFVLARTWPHGTHADERRLKGPHSNRVGRQCPICHPKTKFRS